MSNVPHNTANGFRRRAQHNGQTQLMGAWNVPERREKVRNEQHQGRQPAKDRCVERARTPCKRSESRRAHIRATHKRTGVRNVPEPTKKD